MRSSARSDAARDHDPGARIQRVPHRDCGYEELTSPTTSGAHRSRSGSSPAPEAVDGALLAWLIAEAVGGLALRRYVADGSSRSVGAAVVGGIRGLVRPGGLATLVITNLVVLGIGLGLARDIGDWIRLQADRLAVTGRRPRISAWHCWRSSSPGSPACCCSGSRWPGVPGLDRRIDLDRATSNRAGACQRADRRSCLARTFVTQTPHEASVLVTLGR